jgi:hypothetical protein
MPTLEQFSATLFADAFYLFFNKAYLKILLFIRLQKLDGFFSGLLFLSIG